MAVAMGFSFAQVETYKAVESDNQFQQTKVSIILPTYNEKENISPLLVCRPGDLRAKSLELLQD
jgi:hypothetical protein